MPSSHLVFGHPLLLLPSTFPSIRVFSNESTFRIRWPKYWSFSFSISPSNEYSGLISFRMDWFDLLAVQGTLKSLLQHHSSKASILHSFCISQLFMLMNEALIYLSFFSFRLNTAFFFFNHTQHVKALRSLHINLCSTLAVGTGHVSATLKPSVLMNEFSALLPVSIFIKQGQSVWCYDQCSTVSLCSSQCFQCN